MGPLIEQFNAFSIEIIKIKECYFLYNKLNILYSKDTEENYSNLLGLSQHFLLYPLVILLYNFYDGINIMNNKITEVSPRQNYIRIENILNLIGKIELKEKIIKKVTEQNIREEYKKLKKYRNTEFAHIDKSEINKNFGATQSIKYKLDIDFKVLIKLLDEIFNLITVEIFDTNYYNKLDDLQDEFKELIRIYKVANILRNKEFERYRLENSNLTDGELEINFIKKYF